MINITYHGHSCFEVNFDGYTVILDPYTGVPGYPELSLQANEVFCSHNHRDHNYTEGVTILSKKRPNELKITEIESFHDDQKGKLRGPNTIRIFEYQGTSIMHCGDIGCMPEEEQIQKMMGMDVVMIPVGGYYTMEPDDCKKILDRINPRIIVPMHYRGDGFGYDVIKTVEDFTNNYQDIIRLSTAEFNANAQNLEGKVLILK